MIGEDVIVATAPRATDGFENEESIETATKSTFPMVAVAIPLCAAQLLGTRHMRGQVMKLLRDPHVWLPWRNRNPWKNPTNAWWWNAKPWLNQQVGNVLICDFPYLRSCLNVHGPETYPLILLAAVEEFETVAPEPIQEVVLIDLSDI